MEHAEKEIQALIALLDDSDSEVVDHVAKRLFSYGPQVISKLEDAYASIPDALTQERIESIIHHIQLASVEKDLQSWIAQDSDNLLKGLLIISRHQYPEMDEAAVTGQIHKIQKDIWLGLNHYLSPLEQMNVVNQVLFNQWNMLGINDIAQDLKYSYIHNALSSNKGNHFTLGLLYLILCQKLDMPVYGVCLSSHFILTRTKEYILDFTDTESLRESVLFYINPFNKGLVFGEKEISAYLNKVDIPEEEKFFLPASNIAVLREYVCWLQKLFYKPADKWKADDLEILKKILAV
ncbi:MAG: transglutaminase-like domain-containing protein [Chitinophagales bacterium]